MALSDVLFGPPKAGARLSWNASDFEDVSDLVRGGSSTSAVKVVEECSGPGGHHDIGALDFSGFLDTTTLGGAGFASRAYQKPFPGAPLNTGEFKGLRLQGRRLALPEPPHVGANDSFPGGGKHAVTSYVINLRTEEAKRRPDGRRESSVTYEWRIDLDKHAVDALFDFHSSWSDFNATYRGRPAPDAPALDPAQVKEWSVMARSEFASQSGPFNLRLISLSALPTENSSLGARGLLGEKAAYQTQPGQSYVVAADSNARSSGEYYGFALFILSTVAMVLWLVWALTPDAVLRKLGVAWYPNREWAFIIPAWSMICVLFVYAAFITLNIHNNPPLDDVSNIVDSHSNILPLSPDVLSGHARHPLQDKSIAQTGGIDGPMANDAYDVPPGVISRQMHLHSRSSSLEE